MNEKWHLWRADDRPPPLNMAVDELLLENSEFLQDRVLVRIYGWDRPSISIGYTQKFNAVSSEIGYSIVRRPTGGGIVYHDRDLTYTVVVPARHPIESLDRIESYHVFHRAVLRAMSAFGKHGKLADSAVSVPDRATMRCFVTQTKYDVICENRKLAGAAQRRTKKGILHQGSISLEVSGGDKSKLAAELIKGFSMEFNVEFEDFTVPGDFAEAADDLASAKFATDEWNKAK